MTGGAVSRVALVTGAGAGIGRAIALRLAADGHRVAVTDLKYESAGGVVAEIEGRGGEAVACALDVSDPTAVEATVREVAERWDRLDILVNNAGITSDNLLSRLGLDQWNKVLAVNLTGPFLCIQAVTPVMRSNGYGRVVNISSVAAVHGAVTCVNYCASKAGVLGLTVGVAREFGRYVSKEGADLTCNAVMPGIVDTELSRVMPDAVRQQRVSDTPLARFGQPEDVADAVSFLASEDSRFVTGTSLRIDGGLRMAIG